MKAFKNKLISLIVIFLFFFLANAAQPPPDGTNFPPNCDELITKATTEGELEILVTLNVPFQPEGNLKKEEIKRQRTEISNKKSEFRTFINGITGNAEILKEYTDIIPIVFLKADSTAITEICSSSLVKFVHENQAMEPNLDNTIPLINADDVANGGYTGNGWTVAILDTGVDKNHPFLSGKVVAEACFSTNDPPNRESLCPNGMESQIGSGAGVPCTISKCDHGTHVAGIAAGKDVVNNRYGVARDANIIAVQVFTKVNTNSSCNGSPPCIKVYNSDLVDALTYVYNLRNTYNIASVNMSIGGGKNGSYCSSPLKPIIDNLKSVGIATVVAAGNNGYCDGITHPACISSVVAVGSTTKSDTKSGFSNYDPSFDNLIFAPGSSILSSIPGTGYGFKSGTSMATPHVAGAFAVIRQIKPDKNVVTVDDILTTFQTTGVPISGVCGNTEPRIDLLAAAQDYNTPPTVTSFSANPIIGYKPLTVHFSCSGTDSDGTISSYKWDVIGDNAIDFITTDGNLDFTYNDKGTYITSCEIQDNLLETDKSSTITIIVKQHFPLTVIKFGDGDGTVVSNPAGINCGAVCSEFFDENTDVTLTATPKPDSAFIQWTVSCASCGTNPVCSINMGESERNCGALFKPLFKLNITKSGTGDGNISSSPAGINCGGTCSSDFVKGTTVTLISTPDMGSALIDWEGDCEPCGTDPDCDIAMDSDKNCNAVFNKVTDNGKVYGNFTIGNWPNSVIVKSQIPCSNYPGVNPIFIMNWVENYKYNYVVAYNLNNVLCYDDPAFDPMKPNVDFDTARITLTGMMNYSTPVVIEIEESDGGEPGLNRDYVHITVKNMADVIIFETNGMVKSGSVYAMPLY